MVGGAAGRRRRHRRVTGPIHLVGAGWGGEGTVWAGFLRDAAERAGGATPRVLVVSVRDLDAPEHASKLAQSLRAQGPVETVLLAVRAGERLPAEVLAGDVHGLLVGGGLMSEYLDVLAPLAGAIRALVADGVPYAGFSAGSAIAAERAIVGGWLHEGLPVVAEDVAEGLAELSVRNGLGLVPFSVDVHAAQWGTLARLVTAVEAGMVEWGVAIDEDSALVIRGDEGHVEGAGNAWWAEPAPDGVAVRRETGRGHSRAPRPLRAR
ncbi:Type 1 glutamine amidotransferase-like domain-containing protein [Amnibacterium endophyticum]|uniref:Type 1 glutamine amidotransferase-like domain-containing protein n=1 Tax=Amnibacterium endophyticum TaxID=2109337 RepID=A0ABW4LHR4_9MICO